MSTTWPAVAKAVARAYQKDDVAGLAAEMAYHFIFALFPFLLFVASVAGMIGRVLRQDRLLDDVTDALSAQLPAAAAAALRGPLEEVLSQRGGEVLSVGAAVGFVLALWAASNGVATALKACNRAYGVEETRGFLKHKAIAVGLTVVLGLFLVVGVTSLTVGDDLIQRASAAYGLGGVTGLVLQAARVGLGLAGISLGIAVLSWQGPDVAQPFRWLSPGAVLATLALALLTVGFGFYVDLVAAASYARTYGTAFGLILFLSFLSLSSQVIVLGAELNAEITTRGAPAAIRDTRPAPRQPLPGAPPVPSPRRRAKPGPPPKRSPPPPAGP